MSYEYSYGNWAFSAGTHTGPDRTQTLRNRNKTGPDRKPGLDMAT